MAGTGALVAVALNALFGVCVPGVSQGKLEQSFPPDQIVPLTEAERTTYAEAIGNDDYAYHVLSPDGFILMTTKNGFCRVVIGEGSTEDAEREFLAKLEAAGGHREILGKPEPGADLINGIIPLGGGDIVALVFTAEKDGNSGFFASAFGAHKDGS
jgi:hypothetical protein